MYCHKCHSSHNCFPLFQIEKVVSEANKVYRFIGGDCIISALPVVCNKV